MKKMVHNLWGIVILLTLATLFGIPGGFAQAEYPQIDAEGFLVAGEFVYENPEEGVWRYASPTLMVEIIRHKIEDKKFPLIYFVADVRAREGEYFRMVPKNADPKQRMKRTSSIHLIAQENNVIFATSSDFAHQRIQQGKRAGIIIREGVILSDKTRSPKSTVFPNLDTLALFPDGDMRVFAFDELTAEDYIGMGVSDVLAFGPVLIRDGIINEADVSIYGKYREPRIGVGMYEKGHYVVILAEGRHDGSTGVNMTMLAQMFQELGCPLAINLDGGGSAGMVFMGTQLSRVGGNGKKIPVARATAEILAIGNTALPLPTENVP